MKKTIFAVLIISLTCGMLTNSFATNFPDVPDDAWYKDYVYTLVDKNIIKGYPNGDFAPNDNLKVSELIKMVLSTKYNDIELGTDKWYSEYVKKALELKIIEENEYQDFERPIKRGEIAKILMSFFQEPLPANYRDYDMYIGDYYAVTSDIRDHIIKDYILKAYSTGIMSGYPDGNFKPGNLATRAEASTMLVRFIDSARREKPKEPVVGKIKYYDMKEEEMGNYPEAKKVAELPDVYAVSRYAYDKDCIQVSFGEINPKNNNILDPTLDVEITKNLSLVSIDCLKYSDKILGYLKQSLSIIYPDNINLQEQIYNKIVGHREKMGFEMLDINNNYEIALNKDGSTWKGDEMFGVYCQIIKKN